MLPQVDRTSCDVIRFYRADRGPANAVRRLTVATLIKLTGGSAVAAGVRSGGLDRRREKSGVGSYVEVRRFARRRAARERPLVTVCYK